MNDLKFFNDEELKQLEDAVCMAEDITNNYFKVSSVLYKYDIKTAKDLTECEFISGPFAQVVRYEGRKKYSYLNTFKFNYYVICLQDYTIISAIKKNHLMFFPFLLYIVTHEIIHIIRFCNFQQIYDKPYEETHITIKEEKTVHSLTYNLLMNLSLKGMKQVLEYYKEWRGK